MTWCGMWGSGRTTFSHDEWVVHTRASRFTVAHKKETQHDASLTFLFYCLSLMIGNRFRYQYVSFVISLPRETFLVHVLLSLLSKLFVRTGKNDMSSFDFKIFPRESSVLFALGEEHAFSTRAIDGNCCDLNFHGRRLEILFRGSQKICDRWYYRFSTFVVVESNKRGEITIKQKMACSIY